MDDAHLKQQLEKWGSLSPEKQKELIEALDDLTPAEQNKIIASISDRDVRMSVIRALKRHQEEQLSEEES